MRALGLMSGTSLDGIDVAHVDVARRNDRIDIKLLHFCTIPLGSTLRDAIVESLPPNAGATAGIAELNFAIGEAFGDAVLRATRGWSVDLGAIDVIGSHGQTLYHAPADGVTLQLGEPAVIAARTGITCVGDFRPGDMAAGGQGAPLVPFVDRELFATDDEYRVALNIGGIANVTLLPPSSSRDDASAFDTGPGNMVIDECAAAATTGRAQFDDNGRMASLGNPHQQMLDELLAHPYFAARTPKSTGRETFGSEYGRRVWKRGEELGISAEDVIATVTALTARTIAAAVPVGCDRIIVSGGGARNPTLVKMLSAELNRRKPAPRIDASDAFGVPSDAKEAMAFAVMATEAVNGRCNYLPSCTGARCTSVLGKIVPGANYERLMSRIWRG